MHNSVNFLAATVQSNKSSTVCYKNATYINMIPVLNVLITDYRGRTVLRLLLWCFVISTSF